KIAHFITLENASSVGTTLPIGTPDACPITHQAAISHRLAGFVDRRQRITRCESNECDSVAVKEWVVQWNQEANFFALGSCKPGFKFALIQYIQEQFFSSECRCRTLDGFSVLSVSRSAWSAEKSDSDLLGDQLSGQFQTFHDELSPKESYTSDIAAGPIEACHIAKFDGITSGGEHNGNCRRGGFR